jgi:hypothetical protein
MESVWEIFPDIMTSELEWRIELARKGDGELLAEWLRSNQERDELLQCEPAAEILWSFLADVVAGKARLSAPLKLSYMARKRRWVREERVAAAVAARMNSRRNKSERDYWTRKLCEAYGTTPDAVADFIRSSQRRRS